MAEKTDKRPKTPTQFVSALRKYKTLKAVHRAFGVTYGQHSPIYKLYQKAVSEGLMDPLRVGRTSNQRLNEPVTVKDEEREPVVEGRVQAIRTPKIALPPKGQVNRFFLTCAQNNTKINERLWENMNALRDYYAAQRTSNRCDIICSKFTYVKSMEGSDKANYGGKKSEGGIAGGVEKWFDPRLDDITYDDRLELAPGLVWCGEMNILPTAVRPLSGMEVYTGRKSAIFPHVKFALESVASDEAGDPTKFNYTTGTLTLRNYIQKKAGLKAEFHHCYGFLVVEVDHEGNWFVRQVNADSEGTIYDLNLRAHNGKVTTGHRLEGITWGDPHVAEIDPVASYLAFGDGMMKDVLRPRYDFMGDVLDFRARPWQEVKDPYAMYKRHVTGTDDVEREVRNAGVWLDEVVWRRWCETVVSYGNHEDKLGRWLKEMDGRKDPVNAEFWARMQQATYEHIRGHDDHLQPNFFALALYLVFPKVLPKMTFLRDGEGFVICPDAAGGVQCGIHGHKGPRGGKGSSTQFAKMGRKMNMQHEHAARIIDGVYVPGTLGTLQPDWTEGYPSNWSHSNVGRYPNGKGVVITFWNGKWHADMEPVTEEIVHAVHS